MSAGWAGWAAGRPSQFHRDSSTSRPRSPKLRRQSQEPRRAFIDHFNRLVSRHARIGPPGHNEAASQTSQAASRRLRTAAAQRRMAGGGGWSHWTRAEEGQICVSIMMASSHADAIHLPSSRTDASPAALLLAALDGPRNALTARRRRLWTASSALVRVQIFRPPTTPSSSRILFLPTPSPAHRIEPWRPC